MLSWTTQRRMARLRDGDQCQICGDTPESPYCQLQVHHIIARGDGGSDESDNLVTLCDLCHAVCHHHMGPAWCGLDKFPPEQQEEVRKILVWVRQQFCDFLKLSVAERRAIRVSIIGQ